MTKILLSNWIHILGFYIVIETMVLINIITTNDTSATWVSTLFMILLSSPFLMFSYGLIFLIGFLLAMIFADIVLFYVIKIDLLSVVLIEWILIVPVFIYWAFEYQYWLWLYLSAGFLVTQIIRIKRLKKLSVNNSH